MALRSGHPARHGVCQAPRGPSLFEVLRAQHAAAPGRALAAPPQPPALPGAALPPRPSSSMVLPSAAPALAHAQHVAPVWGDVFAALASFVAGGNVGSLAAVAEVASAAAAGLQFPELTGMAQGAVSTAAHRRPGTVCGHMSVARRFLEWQTVWSPELIAAPFHPSVALVLAAYIRARRNVAGTIPPPPPTWPRIPQHPPPGPFVEPSSVQTEVSRFCGLVTVLRYPIPPYGGPLSKACLQAIGGLDRHLRSVKHPVFVWHVIAVWQRSKTWIQASPDRMSGFCAFALACIGVMRPGFACGVTVGASSAPADFGLPAVLISWRGHTKTHGRAAPPELGGPAEGQGDPVISCVAHDLFTHTLFPFLQWLGVDRPPDHPLLPRVRSRAAAASRVDAGLALPKASWPAGGEWRPSSVHWTPAELVAFGREVFSISGFPSLLPHASGVHAGRVGGEMELEELGFLPKTRDAVGQWAVLQRRMHEVYEATAIQRMAYATSCLGRLPLCSLDTGTVSLGLPADVDWETHMHLVRRLGPVKVADLVGAWVPALVGAARAQSLGHAMRGRSQVEPVEPLPLVVEAAAGVLGGEEADTIMAVACDAAPPSLAAVAAALRPAPGPPPAMAPAPCAGASLVPAIRGVRPLAACPLPGVQHRAAAAAAAAAAGDPTE